MAEIIDYTPKVAESKWDEDAATLAGLPEGKAIRITGSATDKVAFQKAARNAGVTARVVGEEQTGDDEFVLDFIARPLRTRKSAEVAESE